MYAFVKEIGSNLSMGDRGRTYADRIDLVCNTTILAIIAMLAILASDEVTQ